MPGKILMIEDDPDFLKVVSLFLERQGYEVATATDGSAGLTRVREEQPDLLILDLMLPGMSGFEVCRHLRKDPETADLPILMLTAKTGARDQQTGFDLGADDYVTKLIPLSELASRVKSLLFFTV